MDIEKLRARLAQAPALRPEGKVRAVTGLCIRLVLPGVRVSDVVIVHRRGDPLLAEVVGFVEGNAVAVPLGEMTGVGPDDRVESTGKPFEVGVGTNLLGRVLDGLGRPSDGGPPAEALSFVSTDRAPPAAMSRLPITQPLATGIRVVDGLLTLGRGQRVGLFAGSGVGKSTLLGAIARGTDAEVVVVALVGERGREVGEFLQNNLTDQARKRAVVIVATSDAPPLERLRAAQVATAIAEYFRDEKKSVLLLMDSVTRIARAQREVGLAAGEPPARRGYPPSVFAVLPRLLERTGQGSAGSITAIYTVLVEGSDMEEPIADEVRGILDGHWIMSRSLAARGHYPAIDVPQSISRVMDTITDENQRQAAKRVREVLAAYDDKQDLIALGAYAAGSDRNVDIALRAKAELSSFLQQDLRDLKTFEETKRVLSGLAETLR